MNTLPTKGYGRIYVEKESDISKVKEIIKSEDPFEYEYLPSQLITVFTDYPNVVYTHKFDDIDMDKLTNLCWSKGIHIWVFNSGNEEFPVDKF